MPLGRFHSGCLFVFVYLFVSHPGNDFAANLGLLGLYKPFVYARYSELLRRVLALLGL